jgi:hypothetical protein
MNNWRVAGLALILAVAIGLVPPAGQALAQSEGSVAEPQELAPPEVSSPECSWIGQRILMLLWRDDIDTAKDFFEIYDRFGCPPDHAGPAFRCLVQIGVSPEEADPGLPERARACWENPALDPTSFAPPEPQPQPE